MAQTRATGYDAQHEDALDLATRERLDKIIKQQNESATAEYVGFGPTPVEEASNKFDIIGYGRVNENPVPDDQWEEMRAQNTTFGNSRFWDQRLLKGIGKLAGLTVSYTAGNILGGAAGLVEGIADPSNFWNHLMENDVSLLFDEASDWINEGTKIYKTRAEREGSIAQRFFSSGFIFDDLMQGGAFMTSAIASSAIVGGAIGALPKAAKLGMGTAKGLQKANLLAKGSSALKKAAKISQSLSTVPKTAAHMYFTSGYEAGVEAKGFLEESRSKFVEEYMQQYGVAPSEADILNHEQKLQGVAAGIYAANAALVGWTNLKMGFLSIKGPIRPLANANRFQKAADGTWKVADRTRLDKIWNSTAGRLARGSMYEGAVEEGMQGVFRDTGAYFIDKRYNLDGSINDDFMDALMPSIQQAFSDTYGLKNTDNVMEILAGVVLGAAGGAREARQNKFRNRQQESTEEAIVDYMNKNKVDGVAEWVIKNGDVLRDTILALRAYNGDKAATADLDKAIENGDFKGAKDAEIKGLYNFVKSRIDAGHLQDAIDDVNDFVDNSEDLAGDSAEQIDRRRKIKDDFKNYAKIVENSTNKVSSFFNPHFLDGQRELHDLLVFWDSTIDKNISRRKQIEYETNRAIIKASGIRALNEQAAANIPMVQDFLDAISKGEKEGMAPMIEMLKTIDSYEAITDDVKESIVENIKDIVAIDTSIEDMLAYYNQARYGIENNRAKEILEELSNAAKAQEVDTEERIEDAQIISEEDIDEEEILQPESEEEVIDEEAEEVIDNNGNVNENVDEKDALEDRSTISQDLAAGRLTKEELRQLAEESGDPTTIELVEAAIAEAENNASLSFQEEDLGAAQDPKSILLRGGSPASTLKILYGPEKNEGRYSDNALNQVFNAFLRGLLDKNYVPVTNLSIMDFITDYSFTAEEHYSYEKDGETINVDADINDESTWDDIGIKINISFNFGKDNISGIKDESLADGVVENATLVVPSPTKEQLSPEEMSLLRTNRAIILRALREGKKPEFSNLFLYHGVLNNRKKEGSREEVQRNIADIKGFGITDINTAKLGNVYDENTVVLGISRRVADTEDDWEVVSIAPSNTGSVLHSLKHGKNSKGQLFCIIPPVFCGSSAWKNADGSISYVSIPAKLNVARIGEINSWFAKKLAKLMLTSSNPLNEETLNLGTLNALSRLIHFDDSTSEESNVSYGLKYIEAPLDGRIAGGWVIGKGKSANYINISLNPSEDDINNLANALANMHLSIDKNTVNEKLSTIVKKIDAAIEEVGLSEEMSASDLLGDKSIADSEKMSWILYMIKRGWITSPLDDLPVINPYINYTLVSPSVDNTSKPVDPIKNAPKKNKQQKLKPNASNAERLRFALNEIGAKRVTGRLEDAYSGAEDNRYIQVSKKLLNALKRRKTASTGMFILSPQQTEELLKRVPKLNKSDWEAYMDSDESGDVIIIRGDRVIDDSSMPHELIHAVVNSKIYTYQNGKRVITEEGLLFKNEAEKIIGKIRDFISNESNDKALRDTASKYMQFLEGNNRAWTELLTYGLTDKIFASVLMSIASDNQNTSRKPKSNLWKEFVKLIKDIVGLVVKNRTLLDDVSLIMDDIFNENIPSETALVATPEDVAYEAEKMVAEDANQEVEPGTVSQEFLDKVLNGIIKPNDSLINQLSDLGLLDDTGSSFAKPTRKTNLDRAAIHRKQVESLAQSIINNSNIYTFGSKTIINRAVEETIMGLIPLVQYWNNKYEASAKQAVSLAKTNRDAAIVQAELADRYKSSMDMLKDIISNYNKYYAQDIKEEIRSRGFAVYGSDILVKEEAIIGESDEVSETLDDIENHFIISNNKDYKDSASAILKNAISSCIESLDPTTGLPKYYTFDSKFYDIMLKFNDCVDLGDILGKLNELRLKEVNSGVKNGFYTQLNKQLIPSVNEEAGEEAAENHVKHIIGNLFKFSTFVRASIINFESAITYNDQNGTAIVHRTELNNFTKSRTRSAEWNQNFYRKSGLYRSVLSEDGNRREVDANKIWDIIKKYNKFVEKVGSRVGIINSLKNDIDGISKTSALNELKQELADILSEVSVKATTESITNLLYYSDDFSDDINGFYDYVSSTGAGKGRGLRDFFALTLQDIINGRPATYKNGNPIPPTKIFESNDPINELAAAWNITYTTKDLFSMEGPDGAKYYRIALTHNMAETIKKLKRGDRIDFLKGYKFHSDSQWLEDWTNDPDLLKRLKLTYLLDYRDGRQSITKFVNTAVEAEDAPEQIRMLNMFMGFLDGKVSMEVPADAKMFFTISGIKTHNARIKFSSTQNKDADGNPIKYSYSNEITLDKDTIDRFHRYFKTELDLVRDAFAYKQNVLSKGVDPTVDAGNIQFYYQNKSKKGEGAGMRFRHFNYKIGEKRLNEWLDDAERLEKAGQVKDADLIRARIFELCSNEAKIRPIIENNILDEADVQFNEFIRAKIITPTTEGNKIPKFNRHTRAHAGGIILNIGSDNLKKFNASVDSISKKDLKTAALRYAAILNYSVNHHIAMIEFEKVFSGDMAFYGTYDARIKRIPLFRTTNNLLIGKVDPALFDGNKRVQDYILRNKLNTGTFEEVLLDDPKTSLVNYKAFGDAIESSFYNYIKAVDDSIDDEEANRLAKQRKADIAEFFGVDKIKWADGAAYATPMLMKQILLQRGVEPMRIEEAFEFFMDPNLDINKPMNLEQAEKFGKYADMFLGPQKMVYVGLDPVGHDELLSPSIDKMAIFPLFPCFVKGMPVEKLLEMARNEKTGVYDKPILFTTNLAKKVGFATGNSTSMTDPNLGVTRYTRYYDQLGHQLNTDPHESSKVKFGIQAKKLVFTGLLDNIQYGGMYGWQIKDAIELSIRELAKKGNDKFFKKIGVSVENDELKFDLKTTTAYLRSLTSDMNIPASVKNLLSVKEDGRFGIELSFVDAINQIEAQYIADSAKHSTDINMSGGYYIQMSSAGLSVTGRLAKTNLEYLDEKEKQIRALRDKIKNNRKILENPSEKNIPYLDNISKNIEAFEKELNMLENTDNVLDLRLNKEKKFNYGECMVSINLYKDYIPSTFKDKDGNIIFFQQASEWLLKFINDQDNKGEISRKHLLFSWRVPTQSLTSTHALSIVGFLPPFMGDTIIVPDAWTSLNGSDFDIDKIFIVRPEYELRVDDEDGKQINTLRKVKFNESYAEGVVKEEDIARAAMFIKDRFSISYEEALDRARYRLQLEYNLQHNEENACKNFLLDMVNNTVSSNEQMHATMQPLDAVKGILEEIVEAYGISRDPEIRDGLGNVAADLFLSTRKTYTAGADGVGPHANQSNITSLAQVGGLKFSDNSFMAKLGLKELDRQVSFNDRQILDYTNLLISGHVDFATDPVLARLNINKDTYNLLALATLTGIGSIGMRFVGSPILFDYIKAIDGMNNDLFTSDDRTAWLRSKMSKQGIYNIYDSIVAKLNKEDKLDGKQHAMYTMLTAMTENELKYQENDKTLKEEFISHAKDYFSPTAKAELFDRNYRLWAKYGMDVLNGVDKDGNKISDDPMYVQFLIDQMMIAKVNDALESSARSLAKLIPLAQIDAKKFGYTISQIRQWKNKLEDFIDNDKNIEGKQQFFDNIYVSTNKEYSIDGTLRIWNVLSWNHSNGVVGTVKKLLEVVGNNSNDEKLFRQITQNLRTNVLSQAIEDFIFREGTMSNGSSFASYMKAESIGHIYYNMLYDRYSTAAKVELARDRVAGFTNKADYALLDHLQPEYPYIETIHNGEIVATQGNVKDPQIVLAPDFSEDSQSSVRDLRESWEAMMNDDATTVLLTNTDSENPISMTIKDLAIELAVYSLLTNGLSTTYRSFSSLLPVKFIIDSGLNDALANEHEETMRVDEETSYYNEYIDKVAQGMWHNKSLLKNVNSIIAGFSVNKPSMISGESEGKRWGDRPHPMLSVNIYTDNGRRLADRVLKLTEVIPPPMIRFEQISGYRYGEWYSYNPAKDFKVGSTGSNNDINVWAKYVLIKIAENNSSNKKTKKDSFLYRCIGTFAYTKDNVVYQQPIYILSQKFGWSSNKNSIVSGIRINELQSDNTSMFAENNIIDIYKGVLNTDFTFIPKNKIELAKELFGEKNYSFFFDEYGQPHKGITFNMDAIYNGEFEMSERVSVLNINGEEDGYLEDEDTGFSYIKPADVSSDISNIINKFSNQTNTIASLPGSFSKSEVDAMTSAIEEVGKLSNNRINNTNKDISRDYKLEEYNVALRHNNAIAQDVAYRMSNTANKRVNILTSLNSSSISLYDKDRSGANIGDIYINLSKLTKNRIKNPIAIAVALSMSKSSNKAIRDLYDDIRNIMAGSIELADAIRKYDNSDYDLTSSDILDIVTGQAIVENNELASNEISQLLGKMGIEFNDDNLSRLFSDLSTNEFADYYTLKDNMNSVEFSVDAIANTEITGNFSTSIHDVLEWEKVINDTDAKFKPNRSTGINSITNPDTGKVMISVSKGKAICGYHVDMDAITKENAEQLAKNRARGILFHSILEKIAKGEEINESDKTIEYQIIKGGAKVKMSITSDAINSIRNEWNRMLASLKISSKKDLIILSEKIIADPSSNMAGVADLIIIDKNTGKKFLLDYKTSTNMFRGLDVSRNNDTFYSIRDANNFQSAAYVSILNSMGIKFDKEDVRGIIMWNLTINKEGVIINALLNEYTRRAVDSKNKYGYIGIDVFTDSLAEEINHFREMIKDKDISEVMSIIEDQEKNRINKPLLTSLAIDELNVRIAKLRATKSDNPRVERTINAMSSRLRDLKAKLGDETLLSSIESIFGSISNDLSIAESFLADNITGENARLHNANILNILEETMESYAPIVKNIHSLFNDKDTWRQFVNHFYNGNSLSANEFKKRFQEISTRFHGVISLIEQETLQSAHSVVDYTYDTKGVSSSASNINYTSTSDDTNAIVKLLTPAKASGEPLIRVASELMRRANELSHIVTYNRLMKPAALYEKAIKVIGNHVNKYLIETDENGKKTGYLLMDLMWGSFYEDLAEFREELNGRLGITSKQETISDPFIREKYENAINDWINERVERKFTKEFYAIYNKLSDTAKSLRANINEQIAEIRMNEDYIDKNSGLLDYSKMKKKMIRKDYSVYDQYVDLVNEKKNLSNPIDKNGVLKFDAELRIANEIATFNKEFADLIGKSAESTNKELFEKAKKAAIDAYGENSDEYKEWYQNNTVREISDKFWEDLESLSNKALKNDERASEIRAMRNNLLNLVKNPLTGRTDYRILSKFNDSNGSNYIVRLMNNLDTEYDVISRRHEGGGASIEEFRDVVRYEISDEYKALVEKFEAEKNHSDKKIAAFAQNWLKENKTKSKYGKKEAGTLWMDMIPNPRYVSVRPSNEFAEFDPNSVIINKEYQRRIDAGEKGIRLLKRDKYGIENPRFAAQKKSWDMIQKTPELKEYYEAIKEILQDAHEKAGTSTRDGSIKLAQIRKNNLERLNLSVNGIKSISMEFVNSIMDRVDDVDFNVDHWASGNNRSVRTIPIRYVHDLEDMDELSEDLLWSSGLLYRSATLYVETNNISADVENILRVIGRRQYLPGKGKESKPGTATNYYDQLLSIMEMNMYGKPKSATIQRIGKYDVNLSKIGDQAVSLFRDINLMYNSYTILANAVSGKINTIVESMSGQYITRKDINFADRQFMLHSNTSMTGKLVQDNFIRSLARTIGVVSDTGEMTRNGNKSKFVRTWAQSSSYVTTPFSYAGYEVGDFYFKVCGLIAIMHAMKPTEFGWRTKHQYLEAYSISRADGVGNKFTSKNGRYTFEERADGFYQNDKKITKSQYHNAALNYFEAEASDKFDAITKNAYDAFTNNEYGVLVVKDEYKDDIPDVNELLLNISGIAKHFAGLVDGMLSGSDRVIASQSFIGRMFIMHRSPLINIAMHRFKPRGINLSTGQMEEGAFATMLYAKDEDGNWDNFVMNMFKNIHDYKSVIEGARVTWSRMNRMQKDNVKRIGAELLMLTLTYGLLMLAGAFWPDEDYKSLKDKPWIANYATYMIMRIRWEQLTWFNPQEINAMLKSPFAANATIDRIFSFWEAAYIFSSTQISGGKYEGWTKAEGWWLNMTPYRHWHEMMHPETKITWMNSR